MNNIINEYNKILNDKIKYKTFKNNFYEFDYCDIITLIKNSPSVEFMRHLEYNKLVKKVTSILNDNNIFIDNKKFNDFFSIWVSLQLIDKNVLIDPLIPYKITYYDSFIKTLIYLGKVDEKKANEIVRKINFDELCQNAINNIYNNHNYVNNIKIEYSNNLLIGHFSYKNKNSVFNFKMDNVMESKLKNLWNKSKHSKPDFLETVFCLFLRYETLNSGAHQFAMTHLFKDYLKKNYDINFECFASPFNVYYDNYCSLFYDLEKYFNSFGSFYLIKFKSGFYIANPPYNTDFLKLMVLKFIDDLKNSNLSLSFTLGTPNWGKYDTFEPIKILDKSKFRTFKRCMKFGEVLWIDQNNKTYKIPSHCRYVIQNFNGKKEKNVHKFNELINNYWVRN